MLEDRKLRFLFRKKRKSYKKGPLGQTHCCGNKKKLKSYPPKSQYERVSGHKGIMETYHREKNSREMETQGRVRPGIKRTLKACGHHPDFLCLKQLGCPGFLSSQSTRQMSAENWPRRSVWTELERRRWSVVRHVCISENCGKQEYRRWGAEE